MIEEPPTEVVPSRVRVPRHAVPADVARGGIRTPEWLQVAVIFAIFGAALFVAVNEHYMWAGILAVAGLAFGASFVLRRMVGDEYDRS